MAIKRARFDRLDSQWVLQQLRRLDTDEGGPLGDADDSVEEALCKVRWTVLWEVEGWWVCADDDDEIVIVWDQHGPMCLWPDWCVVEEVEIPLSPVGEIRDVVRGIANPLDSVPVEIPLSPGGEIRIVEPEEGTDSLRREIDELQEALLWRNNLVEALQRQLDDKAELIDELQDTLLVLARQSLGEA